MREGNTHDGLGACCLIRLKVENFDNQSVFCQKQKVSDHTKTLFCLNIEIMFCSEKLLKKNKQL